MHTRCKQTMHQLCTILGLATSSISQAVPSTADLASYWRTGRNCGVNCLYLLMRARGIAVQYDVMLANARIGDAGSSLADLCDCACAMGHNAVAGKGTWQQLCQAELPIIVHMDPETGNVELPGHFLLVTAIDAQRKVIDVFDGSNALWQSVSYDQFMRQWTGFVVEMPSSNWLRVGIAFNIALTLLVTVVLWRTARQQV